MTFEEIQRGGVLSADERSGDFDERRLGVSLDEKDIGKMKKKVCPCPLTAVKASSSVGTGMCAKQPNSWRVAGANLRDSS